jgi:hypothetical protein
MQRRFLVSVFPSLQRSIMTRQTRSFLAFTALAALIAGCATAGSVPVASAPREPAPDPGFAVVYIIRVNAEPTAWPATAHLDGMRVAALGQKSYTRMYVAAGEHQIGVTWNRISGQRSYESPFRVVSGETHYLMLEGISQYHPNQLIMGAGLRAVHARAGADAIARCRAFTRPARSRYPAPPTAAAQS